MTFQTTFRRKGTRPCGCSSGWDKRMTIAAWLLVFFSGKPCFFFQWIFVQWIWFQGFFFPYLETSQKKSDFFRWSNVINMNLVQNKTPSTNMPNLGLLARIFSPWARSSFARKEVLSPKAVTFTAKAFLRGLREEHRSEGRTWVFNGSSLNVVKNVGVNRTMSFFHFYFCSCNWSVVFWFKKSFRQTGPGPQLQQLEAFWVLWKAGPPSLLRHLILITLWNCKICISGGVRKKETRMGGFSSIKFQFTNMILQQIVPPRPSATPHG